MAELTVAVEAPRALLLDPADNVAVAVVNLQEGERVTAGSATVTLRQSIKFGHKFAITPLAAGEHVRKYNEVIGLASADIQAGQHVHVHNVDSARLPGPGGR